MTYAPKVNKTCWWTRPLLPRLRFQGIGRRAVADILVLFVECVLPKQDEKRRYADILVASQNPVPPKLEKIPEGRTSKTCFRGLVTSCQVLTKCLCRSRITK